MEVKSELCKYEVTLAEDCKQARFVLQSRIDDHAEIKIEGVDLSSFYNPAGGTTKTQEFQNIPALSEACTLTLKGDGANNLIKVNHVNPSRIIARVKQIDDETVAILKLMFAGLTATEQLVGWLYHNVGQIITVKLEQIQQQLFKDEEKAA